MSTKYIFIVMTNVWLLCWSTNLMYKLTFSFCFFRANHIAGEHKFHGSTLANDSGQSLSATCPGDRADIDLRLAELCFLACVNDVAHHYNLIAAAQL